MTWPEITCFTLPTECTLQSMFQVRVEPTHLLLSASQLLEQPAEKRAAPRSPVTACSWAPSGLAVGIKIKERRYEQTRLLVFSHRLEPLLDQKDMRLMAWSPCSTVLACVTDKELQAIMLPGASSDASKTYLQQVAALQEQTAALSVKQVLWSLGGACCVSAQNDSEETSLHVAHSQELPILHGWAGASRVVLCISPSGQRVLFAATNQSVRSGIWLMDSLAGRHSHIICVHAQEEFAYALVWHPCERHFTCLTYTHALVFRLAGPLIHSIRLPGATLWSGALIFTSSPCGTRLHVVVSRTKAVVVTLAADPAAPCSPAQRFTAVLRTAGPLHWYSELVCARLQPCLQLSASLLCWTLLLGAVGFAGFAIVHWNRD